MALSEQNIQITRCHAPAADLFDSLQLHATQQGMAPEPAKIVTQLKEQAPEQQTFQLHVISYNDKTVGLFTLAEEPDDFAWFGSLQIDYRYQNLGITRFIFNRLRKALPDYGIKGIRLDVHSTNLVAIRLYQSMGFRQLAYFQQSGHYLWLMEWKFRD